MSLSSAIEAIVEFPSPLFSVIKQEGASIYAGELVGAGLLTATWAVETLGPDPTTYILAYLITGTMYYYSGPLIAQLNGKTYPKA